MKVLVTGANGYIGQGVVDYLTKKDVEVIATDFSLGKINSLSIKKEANLFDLDNPYEYFYHPDILIHLAWRDGFIHNSNKHILDLPDHYLFLKKMAEGGIHKICVMGSMHEIGFYEGCINENTPCNPKSLYGVSKNALRQATELLCKENHNLFTWLRGYYIVGKSEHGNSIFSKITAASKEGIKEFPFTMGQNQFDFIDYDHLCEQIVIASLQDHVLGVIECCSGRPEKLSERVERFILDQGYSLKLAYGTFPDRPYDSKAVWGDSKKIQVILNKQGLMQ